MDSSPTREDQRLMAEAKNYFAWQYRLVAPDLGRRVVDIGCGTGNFTGWLLDREAVLAIDSEPWCIGQIRARYAAAANLRVLNADWEAPDWEQRIFPIVSEFAADSCVCLNVLEHMEDDRESLRRMAAILRPGGAIVLMVPAFPSLYGPTDRELGHHRRYTRESIRQLAAAVDLHIGSIRYMNAIGSIGWWINSHILGREAHSAVQIAFFDRYIVPLWSRLESLVAPPFGQSLLVVLRKR